MACKLHAMNVTGVDAAHVNAPHVHCYRRRYPSPSPPPRPPGTSIPVCADDCAVLDADGARVDLAAIPLLPNTNPGDMAS